jgi:hypothetical protein
MITNKPTGIYGTEGAQDFEPLPKATSMSSRVGVQDLEPLPPRPNSQHGKAPTVEPWAHEFCPIRRGKLDNS